MSGPFSEQGKLASSRQPFSEWCKEHGVDYSLGSAMNTLELERNIHWNNVLNGTSNGDFIKTEEALIKLRAVEVALRLRNQSRSDNQLKE